jgi:hypothetical protein
VNWDGEFRSLDREVSGRRYRGQQLSTRVSNRGYGLVDLRTAEGKKVTRSVHSVMLGTFVPGGIPEGMESRHYDDNSLNNRWRPGSEEESRKLGGNLFVGDKRDQHRDKVRNGGAMPPPAPQHDCIGVPGRESCGGKVKNPGRRCMPCVDRVGQESARMLDSGENLLRVAHHFGYEGTRWTYKLAAQHGYKGTEAQALTQKRSLSRRVTGWLGKRRGDAASRAAGQGPASGERNPRPRALRAVSPQGQLGHSGHPGTQDVAERSRSVRPHVPLPAEVTHRNRPPRGGRSR